MRATIAKRKRDRQHSGEDVAGMSARSKTVEQLIGERIRARRVELGLIQEQLATALGISYQQIQKYENGSNRITVGRLLALAERLEVPITHFFAGLPGALPAGEAEEVRPEAARPRSSIGLARGFARIRDDGVRLALTGLVRAVAERQA
jgi:transcriptional regulator with XRE-family HTH domain